MESLEHLQEIVRMSAMEIDALIREHPDLTTNIEYLNLPVGDYSIAGLVTIEVLQLGVVDSIFCYDISLDRNSAGEYHLFCFDVTERNDPYIEDMEQAKVRLRQLLTVFKLHEVTPEKIVVDFFRKMSASEAEKIMEFFNEN